MAPFIERDGYAAVVCLGDDVLGPVGDVHDYEIALRDAAQAHAVGRIAVGDPVPAPASRGAGPALPPGTPEMDAGHLRRTLSPSRNGSSKAAQRMWSRRISIWSGAMRACSGEDA